jgi:DNA-binding SARP family transcriptional activator
MTFLPEDIYEDIFSPYRRRHDCVHTQLIEHMTQLYIQANQLDDALSCALNILSINPYSEEAVNTIVHIHMQQGNTIGAIRQLEDFGSFLKKDLGIEPGKELLTLRSSILKTR